MVSPPVVHPRISHDQDGSAHAEFPDPLQPLGRFLEQDVQSSAIYCRELLRLAESVERRELEQDERTGNAYLVTASHGDFFLENLFDEEEPVARVSPSQLRVAVQDWLDSIESRNSEGGT